MPEPPSDTVSGESLTRLNGVPVWRDAHGAWHTKSPCSPPSPWGDDGRWFPESIASRLVDPDDPQVREAIRKAVYATWPSTLDARVDAIVSALRADAARMPKAGGGSDGR